MEKKKDECLQEASDGQMQPLCNQADQIISRTMNSLTQLSALT